jgi:hypothetical protein
MIRFSSPITNKLLLTEENDEQQPQQNYQRCDRTEEVMLIQTRHNVIEKIAIALVICTIQVSNQAAAA